MRSIERRFRQHQAKHPERSSYVNFHNAVRGQGFAPEMVSRWFNKLVEKDDYGADPSIKKQFMADITAIFAKHYEDYGKSTLMAPTTGENSQA